MSVTEHNSMLRYRLLFCLFLASLFPLDISAQESTSAGLIDCVEELNAECPLLHRDDWSVNSFTMVGDRYALADIKVPAGLSMVFSLLTEDTDNVKQMWIKQLKCFGERWNRFVNLMVEHDRRIIVNLHPENSDETALITFSPSDFKKNQAEEK